MSTNKLNNPPYLGKLRSWLAYLLWEQEVAGSSPAFPTNTRRMYVGNGYRGNSSGLTTGCINTDVHLRYSFGAVAYCLTFFIYFT